MFLRKLPILLVIALFVSLAIVACGSATPTAQEVEEPAAAPEEAAEEPVEETEEIQEGGLVVSNVLANMTVPSDTGSFWMEITNSGSTDDALVGAEVDGCNVIELHDMTMDGDTMVMRQVEGGEIPIPAGETVLLKKGGLHVMCIGKEAPLELGSSVDVALQFANAGTVNVTGEVVEPGEMAMGHSDMEMEEGEEHSEMDMEEGDEHEDMTTAGLDLSGTEIAFWHVWDTGSTGEGMAAIVEEFNNSNEYGITVVPVAQGNQGDLETAINAAIASGDLPNVTPGFANSLANWHSVGVIRSLNEFIEDPDVGVDVTDLYAGPYGQGTLADGSQIGIPIHQSANVLFYNNSFAEDLGFDAPPATASEFKEQACAAAEFNASDDDPDNDGTGGLVHYPGASNIASWVYAFGGDIVNESRDGYDLNSGTLKDVALFLKDLQDRGCTFATDSYPNPEFATRKALFTMSSTAGIPYQAAAFEEAGSDDEWALIPFPGPDGNLAVNAFGQLIGIVETTPEEDLASWLWIRHWTSPEIQADWINSSAYFPSQNATVPLIGDFAAENAIWSQALELSELGKSEPNIPAHGAVRGAIQDAFFAIADAEDEAAVQAILDELQADAEELIEETQ